MVGAGVDRLDGVGSVAKVAAGKVSGKLADHGQIERSHFVFDRSVVAADVEIGFGLGHRLSSM